MQEVLIAGAGKIGRLAAVLLALTKDYRVHLVDIQPESPDLKRIREKVSNIKYIAMDLSSQISLTDLEDYVKQNAIQTLIACLPYFCNFAIAQIAHTLGINYFDTTEDPQISRKIRSLGWPDQHAFVPQCGVAPGFISIVANDLARHFDQVDTVLMRVGALPTHPNNALKYSLNWSTDGLINEYGNPCFAIVHGKEVELQPLEGLETIQIDGLRYEVFNTSGGIGSLVETYRGKVNTMNYKTLRYPGHCRKMRFLMKDLKLNHDRPTLKRLLENAFPKTYQDVVIIYVAVKGYKNKEFIEETYVKKVYAKSIADEPWSAIQITTAASLCAAVDIVLNNTSTYHGTILQESIPLQDFLGNRFGAYYQ